MAKILDERNSLVNFTFSGRTMTSVTTMANEWHAQIQQEREILNALAVGGVISKNRRLSEEILNKRWIGLAVSDFTYEKDACIWTIKQLHSARHLLNEGRTMKNCVASYYGKCVKGESHIFNVTCAFMDSGIIESKATLEVNASRSLIQAKAKCNAKVTSETMSVINRWAQARRIKVTVR
jgi:hypothetical protein